MVRSRNIADYDSRTLWVRGLKLLANIPKVNGLGRTLMGAWIETVRM